MSETKIRVLVVDDHQVVRQGFTLMLSAFPEFELVGEAKNGLHAVQLCQELQPDVVLMDIVMPEMDGIEATERIREKQGKTQIIALTSFNDRRDMVESALQAGALGYLFKDVSIDELAQAIRKVHQGDPFLASDATRMLIQATRDKSAPQYNLSDREKEVLTLIVEGLNNPQIAERLVISRSTVQFHVSSILSRLGAENRSEEVALAVQNKLV